MLIAEKKKKYTEQDYSLLEEGTPFQLIDNDLIRSPSPTVQHQYLSIKLLQVILLYLTQTNNQGLLLTAPMDVKLDEDNIFQPDILYVAESRKNELVHERIEGAPDLIIEILSPSNAYYDLR